MTGKRPLEVTCPTCKGVSIYAESNPWRPFCSERCREIDLGGWASERFRVIEQSTDTPDDDSMSTDEDTGRTP